MLDKWGVVVRFGVKASDFSLFLIVQAVIDSILSHFKEVLGFFTHVQRDGRLKLTTDLYLVFKFRVHGALTPLVYMLLWQEYTNFLKIEGLSQTYSSQRSDMKQVHYRSSTNNGRHHANFSVCSNLEHGLSAPCLI